MSPDPTGLAARRAPRAGARRRRQALTVVLGLVILLTGCSGDSSPSADQASTPTTVPGAVETPTYVDPAIPISSPVGREFAIMLPADPGSGWRWILSPIDNTRLIALGSHFSDDAQLLVEAETATTTTTGVTTTVGTGAKDSTATTEAVSVLPLVQIISFAGRAVGPAALTFQYSQIAGTPQDKNRVLTFSVEIVPSTTPPTNR